MPLLIVNIRDLILDNNYLNDDILVFFDFYYNSID